MKGDGVEVGCVGRWVGQVGESVDGGGGWVG